MRKVFGILTFMFLASLGGLSYAIFYSSAPYQVIARVLEKSGFEISNVSGNLNSGFTVSRMVRKDADLEFVAENVVVAHNSLLDGLLNKRVVLMNFDIGKLHVKLLKPGKDLKSKWSTQASGEPSKPKSAAVRASEQIMELRVGSVRIKDVKIETPELKEPWVMTELTLSELLISKDKNFSLQKAVVRSAFVDFDVDDLTIDDTGLHHRGKISASLHPGPSNQFLKDVVVSLKLDTRDKKLQGDIDVFGGKLKSNFSGMGPLTLEFVDFTPKDFFKSEIPLQAANVKADLPNVLFALMAPIPFTGQFKWRDFVFSFPSAPAPPEVVPSQPTTVAAVQSVSTLTGPQPAMYVHGKDRFYITIKPQFNLTKKELNTDLPWFELNSVPLRTKRESLSVMYYGKPYARLSEEEKKVVEGDERFFAEPTVIQMSNRMPASTSPLAPPAPAASTPATRPE